ncbi:uncharacterized protein TNIN_92831 [Trichonephila inaurata madagascariensis]|uniref:Uncharacterized protein n=1 Tax=Trichonephila inaurata madagascariensis TaxID=2747483 RepID=A0A8X7BV28_9ARAC|nr:uncharacterized protein TNIN_92831 [Trichonephila inaurata madagascariensis]
MSFSLLIAQPVHHHAPTTLQVRVQREGQAWRATSRRSRRRTCCPGSYGFSDARGIHRQVNYVADHAGFRAQVKTNEPGTANQNPAAVHLISDAPYGHGGYAGNAGLGYAGVVAAPVVAAAPVRYANVVEAPVRYADVVAAPVRYAGVAAAPVRYAGVAAAPVGYAGVVTAPIGINGLAGNEVAWI